MNSYNSKGITIISLVITIIIILVLTSITVYTGDNIIKKARLQTINTNMMLIQAKTKTIAEQAKFNKDTSNYKGNPVNNISGNKKIDKLLEQGIIENADIYYLLSSEDLVNMGLEKIEIDDGYIVNYETEEIIYVRGFETEGVTYYKLSEMKNLKIK